MDPQPLPLYASAVPPFAMPGTIVFLATEKQDRPLVLEHFPQAIFLDGTLRDESLVASCKDAEVISTFINTPFPRQIIQQLPKLKLLSTRSVGYDHIDTAACAEQGITVCNVPDYGSHVIAEHVFALLLSTLRFIPQGDDRVMGGIFDFQGLRGMALKGKTIGIVGTGRIGRRVARIAHGFDMHILAVDQCRTIELEEFYHVEYVSLAEAISRSDIISLHVPATADTKYMINAQTIATMKDGVIIVNTARGSLIDGTALVAALDSGKVAHALLDVLEHEDDFAFNKRLIEHPRVVVTPHIAFYADDSMRNMYLACFHSIDQWQRGEKLEFVVRPLQVVCDLPGVKK